MRNRNQWLLAGAFAVAIFGRIWHLNAFCLDGDEIFSLLTSRGSLAQITSAALADSVHPPLFYYVLHFWRMASESLTWLRLLPVLFGVLSIIPLSRLAERPVERAVLVAVAGGHPMLIYYSQHLRMYSLFLCLATLSLWLLEQRKWTALTVVNIAMVYTQYFGVLLVALEVAYIAWQRKEELHRVFLSACITAVAFSPWLIAAYRAAAAKGGLSSNLNWVPRPGLSEFFWFFIDLAGCAESYWAGAYLAPIVFALLLFAAIGRQKAFLVAFAIAPAVLTFAASRLFSVSVWGHRHLVFASTPFLLWGVSNVVRIRQKWLYAIVAVWAVQLCLPMVKDDKKLAWDRLAAAAMAEEHSPTVRFYAVDPYFDYTFRFYLDKRFDVKRATAQELRGEHFWVAYTEGAERLETSLTQRGCKTGAMHVERDRYHAVRVFPVWCQ